MLRKVGQAASAVLVCILLVALFVAIPVAGMVIGVAIALYILIGVIYISFEDYHDERLHRKKDRDTAPQL